MATKRKAGAKGGRPSKYDPKMCRAVIDLMREGASKVEVCAELDISYDTFLAYQDQHPEFLESVKRGEKLSQAWWERLGRMGAMGAHEINPTVWIFNMKNRFKDDWRDNQHIEHAGKIDQPVGRVQIEVVSADAQDKGD